MNVNFILIVTRYLVLGNLTPISK